uniref:DEK_C domain-containing protein n=1 Tax=Haemonchus contortus TaxID=6289 RepID=A0A7I4YGR2_HAECO
MRDRCVGLLGQLQKKVGEILCESRISREKRTEIEKEFGATFKKLEGMEGVTTDNSSEKGIPHELEREVKSSVASLQREAGRKDEAMEVQDAFDWTDICRSLETTFNIDGFDNTGVGRRRFVYFSAIGDVPKIDGM